MNTTKPKKSLKIFIQSMDGAGHTNSCVGLGQALLKRGHKVIFVMNEVMAGKFAKEGFGEILLKKSNSAPVEKQNENNPFKMFAEMIKKAGLISGLSPLEKLKIHISGENNFLESVCNTLIDFNPQIEQAIAQESPDVIILAQFLVPPAIANSNVPMIYQYPCNPIGLYVSPKIPPFFSGFSIESDPSTWQEFAHIQQTEYLPQFVQYQKRLNAACGYEQKDQIFNPEKSYFLKSKYLNIYGYPAELDYDDIAPSPSNSARMDAFCREELTIPFELPKEFLSKPGDKLIYLTLGSMGSIDVNLMKRLVSILFTTPHKYIVSKGPLAEEYELPDNCWGEAYLPQTKILPLVDLVITHGGNNTVTETFCFGKPMIVMPLFSDQYDNAQRIHDKGLGIRIEPYNFEDDQLTEAIDRLLDDTELRHRLDLAAKRIETEMSKEKVCQAIEQVVERLQMD